MKAIYILIPLLALSLLLSACAQESPEEASSAVPSSTEKTVWVGPWLVDCTGVAPQTCLLVKEAPAEAYRIFYGEIEGFDYVEGNEYQLTVNEEQIKDPPADGSTIKWTLVSVDSQTPASADLEDTLWGLVSYSGPEGLMIDVLDGSTVTAQFAGGQVSGTSGCNTYTGAAVVNGSKLQIGPLASTMMFCSEPEGLMDQESAFLAGMQNAALFKTADGKLEIYDVNGQLILVFEEMEATSLVGPEWTVLMYNDTNAITSTLVGTTITANFSEDGTLSGSAGCNNYTAGYSVDGNNIKIEPAATTRKMCSEPEGIMEQEAAYTLALERAATYTIQLDQLTLFGAEGQIIVQYTTGQ